jgi:N5-(carboxyethyl)ornithine synthase
MKTGVFKTSFKENEKRIPIHPSHIGSIEEKILKELVFEEGYGLDYGYTDAKLRMMGCELASREELYSCDLIILPKPIPLDLEKMKEGGTICGWTHAVQQREIADLAIQKKLTLLAWEEMNHVDSSGKLHIFYRNNELAGYAGVLHYLQLIGADGRYGDRKKVVVLGYGSVSRGAIYALQGRGFNDITVYTNRPQHLVRDKNPDVLHKSMNHGVDIYNDLHSADFIINGIMQDVNNPKTFVPEGSLAVLKDHLSIIDISCDKGMGFYFAEPTTFDHPIIELERGIRYYSVDHTPTYLWESASLEISKALLPYLQDIVDSSRWDANPVIYRSIDIQNGIVKNKKINSFQKR